MNYQAVERYGINHIFPETIPKKRSNRDFQAKIFMSLLLIAVGCIFTNDKWNYLVYVNTFNYIILIIKEMITRCCYLYEEKYHINSRYDNKKSILLRRIFWFNNYHGVIIFVIIVITLLAPTISLYSIENYGLVPWMLSLIGVIIISDILGLHKNDEKLEEQQTKNIETIVELRNVDLLEEYFCPKEENGIYTALLIEKLNGLDYGTGMAYSFFHGYLKFILPISNTHDDSVKTCIEKYESNNNVKFATKKLYILVPLSGHCPNSLTDVSNKIEDGGNCEIILKDVAGVKDRVFKNTVYKLHPSNNEVIYTLAEYATPLKTLNAAAAHNSDEGRSYERYKKEIVTNFYMTIDKLIREDPTCKDFCHLIYYKDIDTNDLKLPIDICDLLVEKIRYDQGNPRS